MTSRSAPRPSVPWLLQAWLTRTSLEEVESDSKRAEKVTDKMQRHSVDGATERCAHFLSFMQPSLVTQCETMRRPFKGA